MNESYWLVKNFPQTVTRKCFIWFLKLSGAGRSVLAKYVPEVLTTTLRLYSFSQYELTKAGK